MGYRKGCFRVRRAGRLCGAAVAVAFAVALFGCGGDSGSDAGYDYEIVGDSSAGMSVPDLGGSSDAIASISSSDFAQPLSSSSDSAEVSPLSSSLFELLHSSSSYLWDSFFSSSSIRITPRSSSGMEPPRSSAHEPPPSSSSKIPQSSASEPPLSFGFYTGADISTVQEYERFGAKFFDVDGTEKDIFTLLKDHGFNAIRLKTFVSPKAKYGYAASGCDHDAEAYADKDHIVAYAQKIKAAGMAFLLDIHYSDNWADPGKQIIPERWRKVNSSDALADSVYAYTYVR